MTYSDVLAGVAVMVAVLVSKTLYYDANDKGSREFSFSENNLKERPLTTKLLPFEVMASEELANPHIEKLILAQNQFFKYLI